MEHAADVEGIDLLELRWSPAFMSGLEDTESLQASLRGGAEYPPEWDDHMQAIIEGCSQGAAGRCAQRPPSCYPSGAAQGPITPMESHAPPAPPTPFLPSMCTHHLPLSALSCRNIKVGLIPLVSRNFGTVSGMMTVAFARRWRPHVVTPPPPSPPPHLLHSHHRCFPPCPL